MFIVVVVLTEEEEKSYSPWFINHSCKVWTEKKVSMKGHPLIQHLILGRLPQVGRQNYRAVWDLATVQCRNIILMQTFLRGFIIWGIRLPCKDQALTSGLSGRLYVPLLWVYCWLNMLLSFGFGERQGGFALWQKDGSSIAPSFDNEFYNSRIGLRLTHRCVI
jgi:hypothetical protein